MPSLYSSLGLVLTPASLVWSPLFAGYYSYLGASVSALRIKTNRYTGEDEDAITGPTSDATKPANTHDDARKLKVATRCHANFAEQVPLSFLTVTLAELNGAPTYLVHMAYGLLFGLRVAHVEFGMKRAYTAGVGRPVGTAGTWLVAIVTGVYNFTLGFDNLKRFLGM